MPEPRFIHLRLHSAYSLLEGAIPVKKLAGLCEAAGMPALALTDTGNLFAALEFSESLAKAGIQPIMGCQLALSHAEPAHPGDRIPEPAPIVLLAQDAAGFGNLMKLSSRNFLDCGAALPHITLAQLADHAAGLICLTGGAGGPLGALIREDHLPRARVLAEALARLFPGRLYVEIQRHPLNDAPRTPLEEATEPGLVTLAYELGLPLVATNDVQFPTAALYDAHDALLCIAEGAYVDQQAPRRRLTPEHRFKSQEEMAELFADLPEAVANTVEIARRCAFRPRTRKPILPRFAEDEVEELRRQAREGLEARLAVIPHAAAAGTYRERLEFELGVIEGMGFPGYFLIVADFIKWAKAHDIPVGPGRGSGAGSLVAYALTITDLDPLRYGLLFERFLNPERISMPDFDIDFCMDRREEVIAYVQERYGRDRVAQIITFGALLSKAAVRDVGRVLQMPYGQVDRLSKLIPVEGVKPVSIEKALADEPRLREEARKDPQVARLLGISGQIEGLLRNASTHAAGVVIGDRPLEELVPLYRDPRSDMPATQYNMKWVEQAGLVKFDFLGLKTLTVIRNALDLLAARGVVVDIGAIPLDDAKTYEVYASAQTVAVFQVESTGMRTALRQLRPTCIEDIIALVALYRPGPMENIPKFCNVKNGREPRESLHPTIDAILDETQGIIVYQEQVMEIARKMAGYSLGGADLLRRAMGKKIQAEMDAQKPLFIEGAKANGVSKAKADEVWNLLDKFANYGFNKSHAAAYAVVSYQTAWLKANHPVEFMAAVMNCDIHLTDKLGPYRQEVDRLGIAVVAPCVNRSGATFGVEDGRILYALGALKNVGVDAMRLIEEERRAHGPFDGLFDFAARVDLRRVGKRALEMLARAGALDALDSNRRKVFENLEQLMAWSGAVHEDKASAQVSLFGEATTALPPPRLPQPDDWSPMERLAQEHAAIGFYLSGHPLDDYAGALRRERVLTCAELHRKAAGASPMIAQVAGTVSALDQRKSARGTRFAFVRLSDPTGLYEVRMFSDVLDVARDHLEPGMNVVLTVEATLEDDELKLLARAAQPIDVALAGAASAGLRLYLDDRIAMTSLASRLAAVVRDSNARRRGPLSLVLMHPELPGEVEIALPDPYPMSPQVLSALKTVPGVVHIEEF
ncbi:DNA polymerase III subunit alpha [Amaricoccus sp.]|uniref:DNA polymerase III subunit alpha n=1 Tax=Amaricoccus sp. TaxID=1872485 RepID=UPI002639AA76|nr:DNA polymerase III subunit alpha [Amaricoccus sp.]HRO11533.1 DNA polymerase III subunit alpha [Amaricoccus sp.]